MRTIFCFIYMYSGIVSIPIARCLYAATFAHKQSLHFWNEILIEIANEGDITLKARKTAKK